MAGGPAVLFLARKASGDILDVFGKSATPACTAGYDASIIAAPLWRNLCGLTSFVSHKQHGA